MLSHIGDIKDQLNIAENFTFLSFFSYLEYTPLKVYLLKLVFIRLFIYKGKLMCKKKI